MKKNLLTFLLTTKTKDFSRHPLYSHMRRKWVRARLGQPCYICGVAVKRYPATDGQPMPDDCATLEHYVPVWFLRAIQLPEGIIHEPNFRVCCLKCNKERGTWVKSVRDLRNDVGDDLVDKLMIIADVYLDDDYAVQ